MGIILLIAATPVIAVFLFAAYALIRGSIIRANERANDPAAFDAAQVARKDAQAAFARRQREALVCPHCQQGGGVSRRTERRKQGISGAKATGAVVTGGISVLATGLSQKRSVTVMECRNCGASWTVS